MEPTATYHVPAMRIALASIEPSKTNPRRHFDKAALDELAANIKRLDVVQPILIRPNGKPGQYELVAGERRYRAATIAGLADIPALVRELSDSEVLEIQLVENLQRKDLLPLEEALGYDRLLKCEPKGVDVLVGQKWTVDTIAAKVGKSKAYVYAKLKLLALCPEARKALEAGEISESIALLIARIPVQNLQRDAVKEITTPRWAGHDEEKQPMSYRDAADYVHRTFMLRLGDAPFDVTKIYFADHGKAVVKCGECPKRTGNQPELFADVKSADVCTDPVCFAAKRAAHQVEEREALVASGREVLHGKRAKEILPDAWAQAKGGFVKLDDRCQKDPQYRSYRQLLGKEAPTPVLVEVEEHGQLKRVEVVKLAEVQPLLKGKMTKRKASTPNERAPKPEDIFRERLFAAILPKLPTQLRKVDLQALAHEALKMGGSEPLLADFLIPLKDEKKHDNTTAHRALGRAIPAMSEGDLVRLVLACTFSDEINFCHGKPEALLAAAARYKVDPAKVKKAIADEAKAAAPAKAKPKAKKL